MWPTRVAFRAPWEKIKARQTGQPRYHSNHRLMEMRPLCWAVWSRREHKPPCCGLMFAVLLYVTCETLLDFRLNSPFGHKIWNAGNQLKTIFCSDTSFYSLPPWEALEYRLLLCWRDQKSRSVSMGHGKSHERHMIIMIDRILGEVESGLHGIEVYWASAASGAVQPQIRWPPMKTVFAFRVSGEPRTEWA